MITRTIIGCWIAFSTLVHAVRFLPTESYWRAATHIVIDGKGGDWVGVPSVADPHDHPLGNDSLDIKRVAIAVRDTDLLLMIETRGKPMASNWVYWADLDLLGDRNVDVQFAFNPTDVEFFYSITNWPANPDLRDRDGNGVLVGLQHAMTTLAGDSVRLLASSSGRQATLLRDPARNDVSYQVQESPDLRTWTTIAISEFGLPFSGAGYVGGEGSGPGVQTVRFQAWRTPVSSLAFLAIGVVTRQRQLEMKTTP